MTPEEVHQRAKFFVEKFQGITPYQMGGTSFTTGMDCSEFVGFCTGLPKYDGKKWWSTDVIYNDGRQGAANKRYKQIPYPIPGCIGVYPGYKPLKSPRKAGHVWIVDDPEKGTTFECSSSGGGIGRKARAKWFQKGAVGNGCPIIWLVIVENLQRHLTQNDDVGVTTLTPNK